MGSDPSHYPSLLSDVNSSIAALAVGNSYTFTGAYQDCSNASYLMLEASTNQPVTFTIRWSEDSVGATSYEEATVVSGLQTVSGSAYNSAFLPISPLKGHYFRISANSGSTTVDFFICRVRICYEGHPFAIDSDGKLVTDATGGGGGGGDGAIVDGVSSSIKATVLDLTSSNPVTTALVDSNGDQITSFGGGVQYTEGDTDATITGTAMMWEDTGDTLRAVSAAKPIPVGDAGGSLTVDNATIAVVGSGTEATAQRVTIATDSTGVLSVDDNGSSITVDNPTISVVGSGTEETAQRVTIATDSTGVLSIDDNGGSITVDGTVAVSYVATPTLAEAAFQAEGTIAFGSLTTSYQTVKDLADNTRIVQLANTTDALILWSLDGGTTLHVTTGRASSRSFDLATNGLKSTGIVQAKYSGSAPTVGSVYVVSAT